MDKGDHAAFENLKQGIALGPALALPHLHKHFQLFVAEKKGVAKVFLLKP